MENWPSFNIQGKKKEVVTKTATSSEVTVKLVVMHSFPFLSHI
jgi:hypothetical protein